MNTMQALWHISPDQSEIRSALARSTEDSVSVKAHYSLVSTGTERLVATGRVPNTMYEVMKVPYMEGSFALPVKYGYSLVGEVTTKAHPWSGRLVHLMHPHQDFCEVRKEDLYLIPEGVPARRATLASNMETAVNATWDSKLTAGDKVLIVGFGQIGALVAILSDQFPGTTIHIVEPNPRRQTVAVGLGFEVRDPTEIMSGTYDLAFHTSASKAGLSSCLDSLGEEGRIIELSWYGNRPVEIDLGTSFHYQRKQIISSQVGQLPASRLKRWNYQRRKDLVFKLLQQDRFGKLLDREIDFHDLPELFRKVRNGPLDGIGFCVRYP